MKLLKYLRFNRLAKIWKRETVFLSYGCNHWAYQEIIKMGPIVLPWIFKRMRKQPDHWFAALAEITGESPIPEEDRGKVEKMTELWLEWAKKRGM